MKTRMRVLLVVTFIFAHLASVEAETKSTVLLVGKEPDHAFGTHMYMHTCHMLTKCLALTDGVETVVSLGWPEDSKVADGASTIVLYTNPAAEFLLDSPHRDQLDVLMRKGVGLVTIHWASSVRKENFERLGPRWLSYLGGTWVSNVGLHTGKSPLKQLRPDHPIHRGWTGYELHDEYYLNPTITSDATPLLQVTAEDRPVVVGWAYQRPGGGRSFGTTLGHFYRNFQQQEFRRMIVNAILWTAQVEIPQTGAAVNLSEEDLALPPEPNK